MTTHTTTHEARSSGGNTPTQSLRPLLIAVFAAKVAVAAFLLTTVSFAPPVSATMSYMTAMN